MSFVCKTWKNNLRQKSIVTFQIKKKKIKTESVQCVHPKENCSFLMSFENVFFSVTRG